MKDDRIIEGLETEYPEFDKIVLKAGLALLMAGINPIGKCVYYRRENSQYSILYIQYKGTDKENLRNCIVYERFCKDGRTTIRFNANYFIKLSVAGSTFNNDVIEFFRSMEEKFDGITKDFTIDKERILGLSFEKRGSTSKKFTMGRKNGSRK